MEMKFQTFLNFMKELTLYGTGIDLYTLKVILSNFTACLSDSERALYQFDTDLILGTISRQLSLDTVVNDIKNETLRTELERLKNKGDIHDKND